MLVSMQTIAKILDDLEFSEHKKHFLKLTAVHHKNTQHGNASLLDVMLTEIKN